MALPTRPSSVSEKHALVCLEYLKCFNQSEAYRAVYGDSKNADSMSCRLFAKQDVQDYVGRLVRHKLQEAEADVDVAIRHLESVVTFDPFSIVSVDEKTGEPRIDLTKVMENPQAREALDFEFSRISDGAGGTVPVYKVKAKDKAAAIRALMEYHKLGVQPQETNRPIHVNVINVPIPGSNIGKPPPEHLGGITIENEPAE